MSKLAATLTAAIFAAGTITGAPAWADRGPRHIDRGHPVQNYHPRNHRDGRGNDWAIGLGLLAGTVILLAATESRPPVVVYPSRPVVYLPPPVASTYAGSSTQWWYYCARPAGYYPHVSQCQTEWRKVTPIPPG